MFWSSILAEFAIAYDVADAYTGKWKRGRFEDFLGKPIALHGGESRNMTTSLPELGRVDEPRQAQEYAEVLSRVAAERQPIIVRRGGTDLAAIIPLEYLEALQDLVARQAATRLALQLDGDRLVKTSPPPPDWFDADEPKPF